MNIKMKCGECSHVGHPKMKAKGSMGTEIIFWVIGVGFFFIPIFLLVAVGYSIWRMVTKVPTCARCGFMVDWKVFKGLKRQE